MIKKKRKSEREAELMKSIEKGLKIERGWKIITSGKGEQAMDQINVMKGKRIIIVNKVKNRNRIRKKV